ncbi:cytochrome b5 domain-containing protein [Nesterenkonia halotolerans]|uniref:cytochrome b5 domain-containing protein n=1 Tax=Nesterenkonia halotolerans TaxID=225325 RepID=UPI003EE7E72F
MNTLAQKTHWKRPLLAPIAAGSILLLSACGPGADQDEAPETETAEDIESTQETDAAQSEDGNSDAEESETGEEPEPSGEVLTMDQVEENDSPDSCWAVMDGTVYDLTDWIEDHPGGAERIEGLCGTDAAEAFEAQHGGDERPEGQLAEFEIGTLEG